VVERSRSPILFSSSESDHCHKKEPQAVYACLGFGVGVASTRLLAGRRCGGWGLSPGRPFCLRFWNKISLLRTQLHFGVCGLRRKSHVGVLPRSEAPRRLVASLQQPGKIQRSIPGSASPPRDRRLCAVPMVGRFFRVSFEAAVCGLVFFIPALTAATPLAPGSSV
jgi:hypothetical protein